MPLMDRIYCRSFLEMSYPEQARLIDKVRTIRSSALNAARVSSKKLLNLLCVIFLRIKESAK